MNADHSWTFPSPMPALIGKVILVLVAMLYSLAAVAGACDSPERLRFAFVPQSGERIDAKVFKPIALRVEALVGKPVSLVTPASYSSVIEGLLAGTIDFAQLGPASYVTAKKTDSGITVFATVATKAGAFDADGAFYRSLLVTKGAGPFGGIESLRGATLALTDPASTSGAVIPRHAFPKASGQSLEAYFGKIVYTGDHDHAGLAVLSGKVDAAFMASYHLSDLVRSGKARASDFKVVWSSDPIPRGALVYRNRLCATITEKVASIFLKDSADQNRLILDRLGAQRFVPALDADYRIIRELNN